MKAKLFEVGVGVVAVVFVWGISLHLCRTLITGAITEVMSYTAIIK